MPTPDENYLLLWSIIQQKTNESGQLEGINWSLVAQNLQIDKHGTACVRWSRLKDDFSKLGFPGLPDKSGGQGMASKSSKAPKSPKKAKTANPKARAAVQKKPGVKGRKGNAVVKDEEAENGMEIEAWENNEDMKDEVSEDAAF